jgi:hypothetical protein
MNDEHNSEAMAEIHSDSASTFFCGPPTVATRAKLFFAGVIGPVICLAFSYFTQLGVGWRSPWKSGEAYDRIVVLLSWPCLVYFVPLIFLSMVGFSLWIWQPSYAQNQFVRALTLLGALVAGQTLFLTFLTTLVVSFICATLVSAVTAFVIWLLHYLGFRNRRFTLWQLMILVTVIACFSGLLHLLHSAKFLVGFCFVAALILFGAVPTHCFLAYLRAVFMQRIFSPERRRDRWPAALGRLAIYGSGIAGWIAAWKLAIDRMVIEYSQLPISGGF